MKNSRREITRYLRRFADENGISITALSDDWIFVLERGAIRHVVFGYDLGLNPSTAHRIANDKAATFEILASEKVPALPHVVFMHPRYAEHLSYDGNWTRMLATFEEWSAGGEAERGHRRTAGQIGYYGSARRNDHAMISRSHVTRPAREIP